MSEIRYDANCASCRDAAGKGRAGLSDDQMCVPHLWVDRDRWKERAKHAETEQWAKVWTLVRTLGISDSGCPDSQILWYVGKLRGRAEKAEKFARVLLDEWQEESYCALEGDQIQEIARAFPEVTRRLGELRSFPGLPFGVIRFGGRFFTGLGHGPVRVAPPPPPKSARARASHGPPLPESIL